jgi:hypothetical protein
MQAVMHRIRVAGNTLVVKGCAMEWNRLPTLGRRHVAVISGAKHEVG